MNITIHTVINAWINVIQIDDVIQWSLMLYIFQYFKYYLNHITSRLSLLLHKWGEPKMSVNNNDNL